MTLQVLMPMGGLGSRFTDAGYTTPKPLIEVDSKPMFMRALDSFKSVQDIRHIFVVRKDQDEKYELAASIHRELPDAKIAILDHDTRGAVESCLEAREFIADDIPISVADCDIYFESSGYFQKAAAAQKPDGMLLTFQSNDPRYSFVEVNQDGTALRTAEKLVISDQAILGGYFFKDGGLFKQLADEFISQPLPDGLKEYFMSHLFNMLLERHGKVEIAHIDKKYIFGTPEELNSYLEARQ